jgi:hypothetical protein
VVCQGNTRCSGDDGSNTASQLKELIQFVVVSLCGSLIDDSGFLETRLDVQMLSSSGLYVDVDGCDECGWM